MSKYPEKGKASHQHLGHSGSGDNVGGNKTDHSKKVEGDYIEKLEIKGVSFKQVAIGFAGLVMIGTILLVIVLNQTSKSPADSSISAKEETKANLPAKTDTCLPQQEKLRVDIAHFGPQANQPFAFRLMNDVKDHVALAKYSAKVALVKKYVTGEKDRSQVTAQMCDYRGLVVYGSRSIGAGNQSLTCVIDIVNTEKVEATHRLEEPSTLAFEIDDQSEYISYFISGLLKYYLGNNDEAQADFKVFMDKVVTEKKTRKKNKMAAYVKYYQGRIAFERNDEQKARALLEASYDLYKTEFCKRTLGSLEEQRKEGAEKAMTSGLKKQLVEEEVIGVDDTTKQKVTVKHEIYIPKRLREALASPGDVRSLHIGAFLNNRKMARLPESIGKLSNLVDLYLRGNRLTSLPLSMVKLQRLRTLNLGDNAFTVLPVSVIQLQNLTNLDLSDNKLTVLPKKIGQLQNLKDLNLSNNKLALLPESFRQLRKLKYLNLNGNKFTGRQLMSINSENLQNLFLNRNKLTHLPVSFIGLFELRVLSLSHNKFTSLPVVVIKLRNLATLNLSNNKLTTLPESLQRLRRLKRLNLKGNPIPIKEQQRIKKLLPNCQVIF